MSGRIRSLLEGTGIKEKVAAFGALLHRYRKRIITVIVIVAHTAGALTSVEAVMKTRTPQGAVAWAISLNLFPYAVVPLYWAFGHTNLDGYVVERWSDFKKFENSAEILQQSLTDNGLHVEDNSRRGKVPQRSRRLFFYPRK